MSLNTENVKFLTNEGVKNLLEGLNQKNSEQVALIYNDINTNTYEISESKSELNLVKISLNNKLENNSYDERFTGNLTIAKDPNDLNKKGNLKVQGDLIVDGKTITVDTETLAVKDNFIIINSDGENVGTSLSGIIIRTDGNNNAYSIAYDPVNKSVSLGYGVITDTNNFTFLEGENNPILTRAESTNLQDGQVLIWDANTNKAIGTDIYSISNLEQKFTTKDTHQKLVDDVKLLDENLKTEALNRTAADEGLNSKIESLSTNVNANIDILQNNIISLQSTVINAEKLNRSISLILEQIEQGKVSPNKLWVLSFEPILDSVNSIIGYKPSFATMDDGELN